MCTTRDTAFRGNEKLLLRCSEEKTVPRKKHYKIKIVRSKNEKARLKDQIKGM